jgi:hypothetical protein
VETSSDGRCGVSVDSLDRDGLERQPRGRAYDLPAAPHCVVNDDDEEDDALAADA